MNVRFKAHIEQKKKFSVYLVVITNGDALRTPDQATIRNTLTDGNKSLFLKRCFENHGMRIHPHEGADITVKVVFIYIPYYLSDVFLTQLDLQRAQEEEARSKDSALNRINRLERIITQLQSGDQALHLEINSLKQSPHKDKSSLIRDNKIEEKTGCRKIQERG